MALHSLLPGWGKGQGSELRKLLYLEPWRFNRCEAQPLPFGQDAQASHRLAYLGLFALLTHETDILA